MLPLVLLFIVIPIVEIYVIIQVGQAIGPLWTIALLVVDSIIGSMLMRSQGRAAWRRFTDIFGAAFLLPPTRAAVRTLLVRRFAGRFIVAAPGSARRRPARGPGADVDSTATEVDPRTLP